MDWKFKHFQQERILTEPAEMVVEAARKYFAESLGWAVSETPLGLSAEGYSFAHRSIANLKFESTLGGTKLTIELLVTRAGAAGFMLFDVGGYYSIQIRKWFDGIQWFASQRLTPAQEGRPGPEPPHIMPPSPNKVSARAFNGCLVLIVVVFGIYVLVTLICAVIGLITGNLFLLGRGNTIVVHGMWARIISVVILMFGLFVVLRLKRMKGSGARG